MLSTASLRAWGCWTAASFAWPVPILVIPCSCTLISRTDSRTSSYTFHSPTPPTPQLPIRARLGFLMHARCRLFRALRPCLNSSPSTLPRSPPHLRLPSPLPPPLPLVVFDPSSRPQTLVSCPRSCPPQISCPYPLSCTTPSMLGTRRLTHHYPHLLACLALSSIPPSFTPISFIFASRPLHTHQPHRTSQHLHPHNLSTKPFQPPMLSRFATKPLPASHFFCTRS